MGAKVAPLITKPPRVVEAPLMDFFQFLFFPGSGFFFFLLQAQEAVDGAGMANLGAFGRWWPPRGTGDVPNA